MSALALCNCNSTIKPWTNECNIAIQHRSTFLSVTFSHLATIMHHVAWCGMMLKEVWFSSNIRCNIVQQFFCSRVWTTNLHSFARALQHCCSRARSASPYSPFFKQGQRVDWPKIRDHYPSRILNLQNSSVHCTTYRIRFATQSSTIQQKSKSTMFKCWICLTWA